MDQRIDRRRFLQSLALLGAATVAGTTIGCSPKVEARNIVRQTADESGNYQPQQTDSPPTPEQPSPIEPQPAPTYQETAPAAAPAASGPVQLAVARGSSPEGITRAAIDALGGMSRFVKPGNRVVVKPNILTAAEPQYAVSTNPEVMAALVKMCIEAGAAIVQVFDSPTSSVATAYQKSGIEAAVTAAGARMDKMSQLKFKRTPIPDGRDIKAWSIYEDVLTADVFIDATIAKTHDLAILTMGMKNLMGVIQDRGSFHSNIWQKLPDLCTVIRPTLTVIDAVRVLVRNGPTGGRLSDVQEMNTIIASTDIVAADSYGATLFGKTAADLPYLRIAAEMGIGTTDLSSLVTREVAA